jgi:DNA polymerase III subunit beta
MNNYILDLLQKALAKFELEQVPTIQLESPKVAEHGDWSTNLAMLLAKPLRQNPRAIAQQLIDAMDVDESILEAVEIAGPGFINFRFSKEHVIQELLSIIEQGNQYGKTEDRKGQKLQIEFVSANPTGPLTVGHGRNAVLGDTIARLLEWTGAEVHREYYFNDAGRQMRVLGQSVQARYMEALDLPHEFPEGGYEGEYIKEIASGIIKEHADSWSKESWEPFKRVAQEAIFEDISGTLERMNIHMDSYFNEFDLYENGDIEKVLEALKAKDLVYESEGAIWFRTTTFGKEKDTVLVKSSGEPTYRLPDIAYHANKLERGYDECVDIFGADHIATDLEISIIQHVQADVEEAGSVAIPARRLLETLRQLPNITVFFEVDERNNVLFKTDKGTYKLVGDDSDDFPEVPDLFDGVTIESDTDVIQQAINKTLFAVSNDDLRPAMMGVYFQLGPNASQFVSTDGHRLVKYSTQDITTSEEHSFIVPDKALALIQKSISDDQTVIRVNQDHVSFKSGDTQLITRLINEQYPNYESVIPRDNDKFLTISKDQMLSTVKRVSIFSSSTTRQIRLQLDPDKLTIRAEDLDMSSEAKETIECDYNNESMEIGFNAKYLSDVLQNIDGDEVSFEFSSPNRAGIVKPTHSGENEEMLMLVMPVMLNTYN